MSYLSNWKVYKERIKVMTLLSGIKLPRKKVWQEVRSFNIHRDSIIKTITDYDKRYEIIKLEIMSSNFCCGLHGIRAYAYRKYGKIVHTGVFTAYDLEYNNCINDSHNHDSKKYLQSLWEFCSCPTCNTNRFVYSDYNHKLPTRGYLINLMEPQPVTGSNDHNL
jgi:hypothetical protein